MIIKIYEFEHEWIAAKSEREAKAYYKKEISGETDSDPECNILTEDDMNRLTYYDQIDDKDSSPKRSFKEQLVLEMRKKVTFPELFATCEF